MALTDVYLKWPNSLIHSTSLKKKKRFASYNVICMSYIAKSIYLKNSINISLAIKYQNIFYTHKKMREDLKEIDNDIYLKGSNS